MPDTTLTEPTEATRPARKMPRRRTRAELAELPPIDFASLSDDALIDTTALAQWQDRAPITITDERRRGGGPPFVRFGRTIRYRVGDVRKYIAARTIGAKP